jgi:hypothetical protein
MQVRWIYDDSENTSSSLFIGELRSHKSHVELDSIWIQYKIAML